MAYDRKKIYEEALRLAEEKKLFTIDDVTAMLPCSESVFWEWYPAGSEQMDSIKEILNKNKIEIKVAMRKKWFKSESATLQVALMKLIGTEEEAHRLNGSRQEIKTTELKPIFKQLDLSVTEDDGTE